MVNCFVELKSILALPLFLLCLSSIVHFCLLLCFLLVTFRMCSLNFIPVSALHVIICSGDLCMHSKHTLCWVTRATSITSERELVATSNLNANRSCTACNGLSLWSGSKHNLHRQNSSGPLLLQKWCAEWFYLYFLHAFFFTLNPKNYDCNSFTPMLH